MATQMTKTGVKGIGASRKMLGLGLLSLAGLVLIFTLGIIAQRGGPDLLVNPAVDSAPQPDESILNNYRSYRDEAAGMAEESFNLSPEVMEGQGPAGEALYPRMSATPWEYNHGQ